MPWSRRAAVAVQCTLCRGRDIYAAEDSSVRWPRREAAFAYSVKMRCFDAPMSSSADVASARLKMRIPHVLCLHAEATPRYATRCRYDAELCLMPRCQRELTERRYATLRRAPPLRAPPCVRHEREADAVRAARAGML